MRIDLKQLRRDLYAPGAADFVEVDVPAMRYLAVEGHGDPNTASAYERAVQALFTTAYAVRAALKARTGDDFVVGPLEGLWSSERPGAFVDRSKAEWDWTMLIPLPDLVGADDVGRGVEAAAARRPDLPIRAVAPVEITEGSSLQILHVGAYDAEGPTLARLHDVVMPARDLTWNGPHHEIYLGDPRRVAPARLRTVLRQPVRPVDQASRDGR